MRTRFRGRQSLRDKLAANNAAQRFYATQAGIDPPAELLNSIKPKRERAKPGTNTTIPLESAVNDDIYAAFKGRKDARLWRNNRGVAQYGHEMVRYGVGPKGGSDWIGYKVVTVTPEMVGHKLAQFVAIEAKRPGQKPDDDQRLFLDGVLSDGGIAGCATSAAEALALLPTG